DGCPWHRAQTLETTEKDMLGEVEELKDALAGGDYEHIKEELGDVIWTLAIMSEMAGEKGSFTFEDVLESMNEKMVRRHPHVFGGVKKAETAEEALDIFYEAKAAEKKSEGKLEQ
ncbi:MAG: MazG nucleotide pyrophosphohydrolase domain-containing protein, partial [Candidatus Aenigmatarchaeota archaeon]